MLTVKHIDEWNNESVYEAVRVHRTSALAPINNGPARVEITLPDNAVMCFEEQKTGDGNTGVPRCLYVMNDKGATVASYAL